MPIQPEHQATRWVHRSDKDASHDEARRTISRVRAAETPSIHDGRA